MGLQQNFRLLNKNEALRGRSQAVSVPQTHFVNGNALKPPFPEGMNCLLAGMGCFWGAERKFWETPGVHTTAVGYAGGVTPNPSYDEVCSGLTGHAEVVLVVFDPITVSFSDLLKIFWEGHDPTQGMRQGNDWGTQYRSCLFIHEHDHLRLVETSQNAYSEALAASGFGPITTEVGDLQTFYYAEEYHQQYLAKVPNGYCGMGGTGIECAIGTKTEFVQR